MTDVRVKRGMSLQLTLSFANADGSPYDLTQAALSGMVRDSRDELVATLAFALGAAGVATATAADTSAWPLGLLRADVMISVGGLAVISQTIPIYVDRPVTWTVPPQPPPDPVFAT